MKGVIDLHCDTLTELYETGCGLAGNGLHIDLDRLPADRHWCQTFAAFMPDELRGPAAVEYFLKLRSVYEDCLTRWGDRLGRAFSADDVRRLWAQGRTAALFSVEGGSALGGSLENIELLRRSGVRFLTLTWNGENELAGGCASGLGLSALGRAAVPELEKAGIIIDVSHLSDKAFWQVEALAQKPFAATHSCSRAVFEHRRNLTDDQFKAISAGGGIVGINFFTGFLCKAGTPAPGEIDMHNGNAQEGRVTPGELMAHILHFLELGGEKTLALGSDFDGCTTPFFLRSAEHMPYVEQLCLEAGLGQELADRIMWKNALDFLERYDGLQLR